ncbi:UvrB/UvrC motif-containing protein [Orenia marismortui]
MNSYEESWIFKTRRANLEFELAAQIRDEIKELRNKL